MAHVVSNQKCSMRTGSWRCRTVVLLFLGLAACAGFRGGWDSLAYIGDKPPPISDDEDVRNRPLLTVPGLQLAVVINNQLRTYDTQIYFGIPASIDPRNVYPQNHEPGKTRVFVRVIPIERGFVFRPSLAVLRFGGKEFNGVAGFDFDMWDARGNRVKKGGQWNHLPVSELELSEPGQRYLLSIDFATPVPSPETHDISVDLSRALQAEKYPPLPLIRFVPVRWKDGYT